MNSAFARSNPRPQSRFPFLSSTASALALTPAKNDSPNSDSMLAGFSGLQEFEDVLVGAVALHGDAQLHHVPGDRGLSPLDLVLGLGVLDAFETAHEDRLRHQEDDYHRYQEGGSHNQIDLRSQGQTRLQTAFTGQTHSRRT